ncbi:ATP-binding protein [Pseudoalteromonas arctica]|uniref:ATP-binding protein n=1 Tax=Pseudoalteromonas arctica TaxID=394751 RepID=UPI0024956D20|nr:ATP-binding protein [Pseudoalteromonas arctica]
MSTTFTEHGSNTLKTKAKMLTEKTFVCAKNKEELDQLLSEASNVIELNSGCCTLIVGDSGSGKTTLLKKFKTRFNEQYTNTASPKGSDQACYIRSPSNMSPLDLYRAILKGFDEPGIIEGTEVQLRIRIAKQMQTKRYRVLLFDEFQQVVEKVGIKSVRQIADYLKELVDEFNAYLVFAGTSKVQNLLSINEQFASRNSLTIQKSLLSVSTKNNYRTYVSYLLTLNENLKFTHIDFTDPQINLPLFATTNGDLRQLTQTLSKAILYAAKRQRDEMLLNDLIQTFSPKLIKGRTQVNPYSQKFLILKKELGVNYEM